MVAVIAGISSCWSAAARALSAAVAARSRALKYRLVVREIPVTGHGCHSPDALCDLRQIRESRVP